MYTLGRHHGTVKKRQDPKLLAAVGRRLNALLAAKEIKDAEMARRLGIKPQTWHNYTIGERPLPIDIALKLAADYGLSLDWLYRGDKTSMPHGLLVIIEQHLVTEEPSHLN